MSSLELLVLIGIIILLFLANGFFSLIETALMESHKRRLEKRMDDGDKDAKAALAILEEPEDALSVTQLGITLMGILLGITTGVVLAPLLSQSLQSFLPHPFAISLVIAIAVMTYVMLLIGEFLPKRIALQYPEKVLLKHHEAISRLTKAAKPLISFLGSSANAIMLVFGLNPQVDDAVTEDEVKDLIEQGTEDGTFEKTEQYMVDRVFHLSDQTAYALMTPRTQMLWLDLKDSLRHNLRVIRQNNATVFPVGRDSLDDFCGILYVKDLLNAALEHKSLELSKYLRKPMFVPRSIELFRLLEKFRDTGIHEAMVLDEYGGVIGFITLEDILEEIAGNTKNGKESDPLNITPRDEHSWYVDGLYPIDDFKARFDIDKLPDEDHDHYQTMGGFLTSYFGYIPKAGEKSTWRQFTFEVVDMDRARINKILVTERNDTPKSEETHHGRNR